MTHRVAMALALLWLAGLAIVPTAGAQDYDLSVDPNSPSGREYALPTDRARRDAAGQPSTPTPVGSDGTQAPLFGIGIGPAGGTPSTKSRQPGRKTDPSKSAPTAAAEPPPALKAAVPTPASDSGQLVAIGGAGAAVLLLGGVVGLLMRRRRTS